MRIQDYLKERWITLVFLLLAFLFAFTVYRLDNDFSIRESNADYIVMGWGFLFAAWLTLDYYSFKSRAERLRLYCRYNGSRDEHDEFFYPSDRLNASLVRELAAEYEQYKADIETKSAEEMEFITKWLHDVKVPIAASRLILESQEDRLPGDIYQNLYTEIFSIEESIMQVFYEMKSNRFFDDYKIVRTSVRKLVANALKGYSSFFSYKKFQINVAGEDYEVITDEKWSSYILSQIISNAVKYTPEEGKIEIFTEKGADQQVTVSIKNQGKGIGAQDIGSIFNKGFTSSVDREGAKATGYGLYLSRKLSERLGHSLTAESKEHEYALFRLTFYKRKTLLNNITVQCDENVSYGEKV
jgi:signal transduction histidine kinase